MKRWLAEPLLLVLVTLGHYALLRWRLPGPPLTPILVSDEPSHTNDRSIVFTSPSDFPSDKAARFLSDRRNRTAEERRGSRTGRFRSGEAGVNDPLGLKELLTVGQTPNLLPDDIRPGDETILNTDRYVYASFINRIADSIYEHWVNGIDEAVATLRSRGRTIDSGYYVSKIGIVLNPDGLVTNVFRMKSSGLQEFDDAALRAFWDAGAFPNPPTKLFRDSERLTLLYEFHVKLGNRIFEILPWTV